MIKKLLKKLSVLLSIMVAVLAIAHFSAKMMIKPSFFQQQIEEVIHQETGIAARLEGEGSFSLLPLPMLTFKGLELDSSAVIAPSVPHFSIERIEIIFAPFSLFSGELEVTGVNLVHPVLEVERADDGAIHWSWLNTTLLNATKMQMAQLAALPVDITGGVIRYQDVVNSQFMTVENLQASGRMGGQFQLAGGAKVNGKAFTFSVDNQKTDALASLVPADRSLFLNAKLAADARNTFGAHGAFTAAAESVKAFGTFIAETDDLKRWLIADDPAQAVAKTGENAAQGSGDQTPEPFAASGEWNMQSGIIALQKMALKGAGSEGGGSAKIYWEHWYPTVDANLDVATFDFTRWQHIATRAVAGVAEATSMKEAAQQPVDMMQTLDFKKHSVLPANITMNMNMSIQKMLVAGNEWGNARLDAILDAGAVTINQCDIGLPDEGLASLFGVISQGGNGKLKFEGNLEAKGHSLHQALAMVVPSSKDFPDIGMGDFSVFGNLYVAPGMLRLSELESSLQDSKITGAVMMYMEGAPRVEAKLKIQELDFDYVRDTLRAKKQELEKEKDSGNIGENISKSFAWLRDLGVRIDASVSVGKFTFLERQGDSASFSVYAYDGDFKLYDMQLKYPDYTTDFQFGLNVKFPQPAIKISYAGDQIDTRYFSLSKTPAEKEQKTAASEKTSPKSLMEPDEPIIFKWLEGFHADIDISLRKLLIKDLVLEKVKFQGKIEDRQLAIQKFNCIYAQAKSSITGNLFGGRVPGISISFLMVNGDLFDVLHSILGVQNVSGYANVSGTLVTSGRTYRDWIKQIDSKLLFSARGVKVEGVNMAGVSNAISVARSSADTFTNVTNAFNKGATEFMVDGTINIKNGELRTPGLNLRTGNITGSLVGGMNANERLVQSLITFNFPALANPAPSLVVQMTGKLDKPDMKLDTSSLEAYVVKRMVMK